MKKLMAVISALLMIASVGFTQSKADTVCLNREDAIRKARQADSLEVAKKVVDEQKVTIAILRAKDFEKDTTISGLKGQISTKDQLVGSKDREIKELNDKFKLADDRGNLFDKKLKRANTRTVIGTIAAAAIPIIINSLKKRK